MAPAAWLYLPASQLGQNTAPAALKEPLLHGTSTPPKQKEPAEQACASNVQVPELLTVYLKPGINAVAVLQPPVEQSVPAGQRPLQVLELLPESEPK
jgi:hypothetical protein